MPLHPGEKLGPYEVQGLLGAGGMGEVYRASDTRLGRDVAVKVLPAGFADHPERVRRFEQEARAVAALNHPNILAVYDVGDHEGMPYLVMELLEGESLRERLLEGKVPMRRALDLGAQIAEGLAAAHEKGIVHRDLKPGNVFITKDGRAKILDFGLARLMKGEAESAPDSAAPTAEQGTKPGTVLGTVGYMSPEQVKGKTADARSDIFSLGVMLYEMLSGKRPFQGDSEAEVMTAILKEDPPPLATGDLQVPPMLERTVAHCLEKSPDRRFQSARDIAFALESVSSSSGISVTLPPLPEEKRRRVVHRVVLGLLAGGVAAALLSAGAYWAKHEYQRPIPTYTRITFRRGTVGSARFTPDMQSVVYAARWAGGDRQQIYVQRLASPDARPLGVTGMVVAASGAELFYVKGSPDGLATLSQMPLEGGTPRDLLSDVGWSADSDRTGTRFAVVRSDRTRGVRNVQLEYPVGKSLVAATGLQGIGFPRVSPEGARVTYVWREVFQSVTGDVRVVDTRGNARTLVRGCVEPKSLAWSADGREIWFTVSGDSAAPEIRAVSLSGRERLVARLPVGVQVEDIAPDGRVLVVLGQGRYELRGRMAGDAAERDYSWLGNTILPSISPDGTQMVFQECGEAGGADGSAYHWRVGDSAPKRIARGTPVSVSPDWTRVLVVTGEPRTPHLETVPIGAGESMPLPMGLLTHLGWALWHPDGKRIVIMGGDAKVRRALYVQDVADGPPRFLAEGGWPTTFTPDGRYVVAMPKEGLSEDRRDLLFPMDGGRPEAIPLLDGQDRPITFSPDGRFLFVYRTIGVCTQKVERLDLKTGRREPWLELAPPDLVGTDTDGTSLVWLTPDGRYYLYGFKRTLQDLYVAEGLR